MTNSVTAMTAYIAMGSNVGDREHWLRQAIDTLDRHNAIEITKVSNIYETDPVGYTEQPSFLNMVIEVRTTLSAPALLLEQLAIEQQLGRVREVQWGPRTIDLDLLLYDNVSLESDLLVLPHPRMMERAFVLVPLHDVLSKVHLLYNEVKGIAEEALQLRKEGITLWTTIN